MDVLQQKKLVAQVVLVTVFGGTFNNNKSYGTYLTYIFLKVSNYTAYITLYYPLHSNA